MVYLCTFSVSMHPSWVALLLLRDVMTSGRLLPQLLLLIHDQLYIVTQKWQPFL